MKKAFAFYVLEPIRTTTRTQDSGKPISANRSQTLDDNKNTMQQFLLFLSLLI